MKFDSTGYCENCFKYQTSLPIYLGEYSFKCGKCRKKLTTLLSIKDIKRLKLNNINKK